MDQIDAREMPNLTIVPFLTTVDVDTIGLVSHAIKKEIDSYGLISVADVVAKLPPDYEGILGLNARIDFYEYGIPSSIIREGVMTRVWGDNPTVQHYLEKRFGKHTLAITDKFILGLNQTFPAGAFPENGIALV